MTEESPQDQTTPEGVANGVRRGNLRRRRNGRNGRKPTTSGNDTKDPETTTPTVTVTNDQGGPTPSKVLEVTNNTPSDAAKTPKRNNQRRRNRGRNTKPPAKEMNGTGETFVTTEPSISLVAEPDVATSSNSNSNGNTNINHKNNQDRQVKRRNKKKVAPSTEESNGDSGTKEIAEVSNPEGAVSMANSKDTPQEIRGKKRRNRKGKNPKQGNSKRDLKQDVSVEVEVDTTPADAANTTNGKGKKKNPRTIPGNESLDPALTMVRPSLRITVASPETTIYTKPLSSHDIILVPDLFGKEDDWSLYNKLVEEFEELQKDQINGANFKRLYKGAHMVVTNPSVSKTFQEIVKKLCQYFQIKTKSSRLDWYRDSKDWKPFHHDSSAYNKNHAKQQNIAVMASFGASREFAFLKSNVGEAVEPESNPDTRCRVYFPQPNNSCISFGQEVNLHFKHAVNALPDNEHDGTGRISILVWGWTDHVRKQNELQVAVSDPATLQPEKMENEATEHPPKTQRARRNLRRKNWRKRKGAAQKIDDGEISLAETTPESVIHA